MTSCNQLHSITACNIQASPSPAFQSLKRYCRIAAQPQLDPSKSRQNAPKKLRYGQSYSFRSAFAFCIPDGSSTVTCILCMQASLNSKKNNMYVLASLPDQTSQNISQLLSPSSLHHAQHGNHQVSLPNKAPHATCPEACQHGIPQYLQSCVSTHTVHPISKASPIQDANYCSRYCSCPGPMKGHGTKSWKGAPAAWLYEVLATSK